MWIYEQNNFSVKLTDIPDSRAEVGSQMSIDESVSEKLLRW